MTRLRGLVLAALPASATVATAQECEDLPLSGTPTT
jgi:hypothetical protein